MASGSSIDFGFFRVILESTLEENTLRLPKKFVRIYGETLSSSVFLRSPYGSAWKIGVTKKNGKVLLRQGWAEFSEHYALGFGHLVIFRYIGNSIFRVSIFDNSGCEIDRPKVNRPKNEVAEADDDIVHISDNDDSVQSFDSSSAEEESLPSSLASTTKRGRKPEVLRQCTQRHLRHSKAFESASRFFSTKPFFISIVTNPYNKRLPGRFVERHIELKTQEIRLEVGTRWWPVTFLCCNSGYFLCGGFFKFLKQNSLGRGDVCVYELNKKHQGKVILKVSLFRRKNHRS